MWKQDVVSIIVPCYNHERYLRECLESVRCQTYGKWECIIVDDGSVDNSKSIALGFCDADQRFRYHFQNNSGLSAARNTGMSLAEGEYLNFLDSDDALFPNALAELHEVLSDDPTIQMVYSGYVGTTESLTDVVKSATPGVDPATDDFYKILSQGNALPVHSALLRYDAVARTGLFDETLKACEDWDFWLRLGRVSDRIRMVRKTLVIYRMTLGSMTRNVDNFFNSGLTVLTRISRPDPRVTNPLKKYENGLRDKDESMIKFWYLKCIGFYLAKRDLESAGKLLTKLGLEHKQSLAPIDSVEIWRNLLLGAILTGKRKEAWKIYGAIFSEFAALAEKSGKQKGFAKEFRMKVIYYNAPFIKRMVMKILGYGIRQPLTNGNN